MPRQMRGGLFAMSINVHVSRSPRAPAIDLRALRLDARHRALQQRRSRGGAAHLGGDGARLSSIREGL